MGIGKRSNALNSAALAVARRIALIEFDADGGKCDPFDVAKHLTSDDITKEFGL